MSRHHIVIRFLVLSSVFMMLFSSCRPDAGPRTEGKLRIVTTTGMIADAVRNIGGDKIEVISLMGPGVDPHLYKPSHGDVERISSADLILYNGLHLEGKMGEVLQKTAKFKHVVAVSKDIPKNQLRSIEGYTDTYDPHIWFDIQLWKQVVKTITQTLAEKDSANAAVYQSRTAEYIKELDSLHQFVLKTIGSIPEQQRVMITAHDAFGYFGDAYTIEVRGLQGISTLAEFGLRDVTTLVNFIIERKIKAIFIESSMSDRSINAVLEGCRNKGWNLRMGGTLYSDAMGDAGTSAGTYTGMIKANVKTIAGALK